MAKRIAFKIDMVGDEDEMTLMVAEGDSGVELTINDDAPWCLDIDAARHLHDSLDEIIERVSERITGRK